MKRLFKKRKFSNKKILTISCMVIQFKTVLAIFALIGIVGSLIPVYDVYAQTEYQYDIDHSMLSKETDNVDETASQKKEDIVYTTTDDNFDISDTFIISEVVEKRTLNSKTFRKEDGTYVVAMYGDIIHYEENGKFKDIDNRLVESKSDEVFETKSNKFKLKFPKIIGENEKIKLKTDDYSIGWSILDSIKSDISYQKEKAKVQNIKELTTINQNIVYDNVKKNVGIEYVVTGSKIKENIILKEYERDFCIRFEYELKNLDIIKDKNDNILFVNDKNEVIFTFDELYMFDSKEKESFDIKIDYVKKKNKTYEIIITPSDKWLKVADYPVVIDPSITYHPSNDTLIRDKYVYGRQSSNAGANYIKVGSNNWNKYRSYLEMDLSNIPNNSQVTYAHLAMKLYGSNNTCTDNCIVYAKEVEDSYDFDDIRGQGLEITEDKIIDYQIVNSDDSSIKNYIWDISKNVKKWVSNGDASRIIEFSMKNESNPGYIYFQSTNYSSITGPTLEIGYELTSGLKDYWTYNEQDLNAAGTGYVSDYTGLLTVSRSDLYFETEKQSFGLSFMYNVNDRNTNIGYGLGWKTNYSLTMNYDDDIDKYFSVDGTGNAVYYHSTTCDSRMDVDFDDDTINTCYLNPKKK